MEEEIFSDKTIAPFLSRFPKIHWFHLLRLLAIHGIQELRASINIDSLNLQALETIIGKAKK